MAPRGVADGKFTDVKKLEEKFLRVQQQTIQARYGWCSKVSDCSSEQLWQIQRYDAEFPLHSKLPRGHIQVDPLSQQNIIQDLSVLNTGKVIAVKGNFSSVLAITLQVQRTLW